MAQTTNNNQELVQWTKPNDKKFETCNWEAGLYDAQIKEVQDTEGQYGPMKRFILNVLKGTGPSDLAELAWVGYPRVNPTTKMGKALLALGIKEGEPFKWADLVGKKCKVYMKPTTYKNKKGETVTATQIQDINKWQ